MHCKRVNVREYTAYIRAVTIKQSEEWTAEIIRKTQQKDSDIGPLLKQKEDNNTTTWMGGGVPGVGYWLFKKAWESAAAEGKPVIMQLAIPKKYVPGMLEQVHEGVTRTILLGALSRGCREYVPQVCILRTYQGSNNMTKRKYNVGAPLELIDIDVARPFPTTADNNHFK